KRARELTATLAARRSVPPRIEPRSGLELGPTLGQGGMGVVRSAKQLALDRDVAVKTVQPKLASELATRMLLQEALILGRLEHPNILPVYDIRHEAGEPRIVLKKIEGIEWSSLMHRPELIREELGENDALDWNLEILMTVCNAIHFAHSRGVIHRDLKPENVMIGEFGEVYVMDWGLAVCLEDDGTHRFPLASEAKALAGTPQYMAPEMLGGAEARISERTDVYLLGAILYEIIAGHPPHRGKEMREMLSQVVISRPPIPDRCPSELARICRMAMDPEPGWRFENADALRDALLAFRRHTGSRKLADQAVRRTDELIARIAESRDGKQVASTSVQNLFGECRFAYQQALEAWPENDVARSGLSRATRAMIDHELAQHNPRSAANLLATLESPDAALRTRVADSVTALEQSEARMADLERLRKQLDMSTGTRNRAIGASVLGLVWTVAPLLAPFSLGNPRIGRLPFLLFPAGVLIALGIWAFLARVELRESSVTRRLMRAATIAMLAQLVFESATALLHIDPVRVEALWPLLWFCVSAMLSVTVDRRMWPMTLGFLGALFVGASVPAWRFYAMAGSNLIMTVNMFSIWMPWQKLLLRRAPHADEPRR
ncbi:MAG TPA: serine/threonine-protein kinase, partial [Polyangiales bacterium]|nr:serine/threonine-protein kinase [Polyangiales bacterium]